MLIEFSEFGVHLNVGRVGDGLAIVTDAVYCLVHGTVQTVQPDSEVPRSEASPRLRKADSLQRHQAAREPSLFLFHSPACTLLAEQHQLNINRGGGSVSAAHETPEVESRPALSVFRDRK